MQIFLKAHILYFLICVAFCIMYLLFLILLKRRCACVVNFTRDYYDENDKLLLLYILLQLLLLNVYKYEYKYNETMDFCSRNLNNQIYK